MSLLLVPSNANLAVGPEFLGSISGWEAVREHSRCLRRDWGDGRGEELPTVTCRVQSLSGDIGVLEEKGGLAGG